MARYALFATSAGAPATGLSPEIVTWRSLDDTAPTPAAPAITELEGGIYTFQVTLPITHEDVAVVIDLDPDEADGIAAAERYIFVVITPDDAAITELRQRQILALAGHLNFRIVQQSYDGGGRLAAAVLRAYADGDTAEADEDPILSVLITATYNGAGQLNGYLGRLEPEGGGDDPPPP